MGQMRREALLLRWFIKYSSRLFGILDGLSVSITLRRAAVWLGLAFFWHQPLESVTGRVVGESLLLAVLGGFVFVLGPRRQALHDRLSGTAVFSYSLPVAKRGFEPVLAVAARVD